MTYNLTFKSEDKIIIYNLNGVELNINPEYYGWADYEDRPYHRLFGEFFYCGLLLDGQLIVSEKELNDKVEPLKLTIDSIVGSIIYFRAHNKKQLHNIRTLILKARCIGDEEAESDVDENYTFYLIG